MDIEKLLNGVPTKLLLFGPSFDNVGNDAQFGIIVIPGNPGAIEYYREFMACLHERLSASFPSSTFPIWGVSHAGHQVDDRIDNYSFPSLKENHHLYDLNGQVDHKLVFLNEFVPRNLSLVIIGHSIGCKITMEILNQLENSRILKSFMLFPTIERMRETPNGKFMSKIAPYRWLLSPVLWTLSILPSSLQRLLVSIQFFLMAAHDTHDCIKTAAVQLLNKDVLDRVATMGMDELEKVVDLDEACLRRHLDKFFFYFGTTDDWCPLHFAEEMIRKFPELGYKICESSIPHAFVIGNGPRMAEILHPMLSDIMEKCG